MKILLSKNLCFHLFCIPASYIPYILLILIDIQSKIVTLSVKYFEEKRTQLFQNFKSILNPHKANFVWVLLLFINFILTECIYSWVCDSSLYVNWLRNSASLVQFYLIQVNLPNYIKKENLAQPYSSRQNEVIKQKLTLSSSVDFDMKCFIFIIMFVQV